jgi:hypothetical protein
MGFSAPQYRDAINFRAGLCNILHLRPLAESYLNLWIALVMTTVLKPIKYVLCLARCVLSVEGKLAFPYDTAPQDDDICYQTIHCISSNVVLLFEISTSLPRVCLDIIDLEAA